MWRYVSETQSIGGVPARDLTDAEFDKLEAGLRTIVRASGIYQHVDAAPEFPRFVGKTVVAEYLPDAPQIVVAPEPVADEPAPVLAEAAPVDPAPAKKPLRKK